jgi:hypothetical protein
VVAGELLQAALLLGGEVDLPVGAPDAPVGVRDARGVGNDAEVLADEPERPIIKNDEAVNDLSRSTVVIIGGSSGMGLETARQAHAAGAKLILTGRNQGRLAAAGDELAASTSTLDLSDTAGLGRFFAGCPHRSTMFWSPGAARRTR